MSVIRSQMAGLLEKAGRYTLSNWGSPFVLAFIVLLLASAVILSEGQSDLANTLAIYAFYALVIGVVLQIVSSVEYRMDKRKSGNR